MAQSAARNAIVYALHKYLRMHTAELSAHVLACLNSRSRLHSIINITYVSSSLYDMYPPPHMTCISECRSRLHSIINITLTSPISPVPHPLVTRRSRTQHTHAHTQHRCGGGGSGGEAVLFPVRHRINKRVGRGSRADAHEREFGCLNGCEGGWRGLQTVKTCTSRD